MKNSRNSISKRRIVVTVIVAVVAVLLFWLILRFVVDRDVLDEQFGDTGEWGAEGETVDLTFGDKDYVSDDNLKTYLIIGTDGGGEDLGKEYKGTLADFLTLLVIDNTTKRFAFIQIDRNTMTPIITVDEEGGLEELAEQQVCLAHWYGKDETERNNNTMVTVSQLFGGLEIDDYYAINMSDMDKINNAIGGVTVEITEDMTSVDPEFVKGTSVHLEDGQAEKFVRARTGVGDGSNKARMARQTQYMQKAYNMVTDQLKENPEYINDLYDKLRYIIVSGEENGGELSRITNCIIQYDSLGILQIDGTSKMGKSAEDGQEHEEFYVEPENILSVLKKVADIREDE